MRDIQAKTLNIFPVHGRHPALSFSLFQVRRMPARSCRPTGRAILVLAPPKRTTKPLHKGAHCFLISIWLPRRQSVEITNMMREIIDSLHHVNVDHTFTISVEKSMMSFSFPRWPSGWLGVACKAIPSQRDDHAAAWHVASFPHHRNRHEKKEK